MQWLDGTWHEGDVAPFDLRDRGLLLGDGVFDTAMILGGQMVWRHFHVDRLAAAASMLGFVLDPTAVALAIDAVVSRIEHGTIRITVTRGVGPRGLAPPGDAKPMILATGGLLPTGALFAPLDLHVTTIRRNETSPTSRMKSLNYLDGILAMQEAQAAGRADALVLNTRRKVACTSVGNVFAIVGDRLVTPPLQDGVVDGIVRRVLLRACDTLGLCPVERSLVLSDLETADAVFVTNSLRLVAPVRSIGRKPTRAASLDAIVAYLARLIQDGTGIDPRTLATR